MKTSRNHQYLNLRTFCVVQRDTMTDPPNLTDPFNKDGGTAISSIAWTLSQGSPIPPSEPAPTATYDAIVENTHFQKFGFVDDTLLIDTSATIELLRPSLHDHAPSLPVHGPIIDPAKTGVYMT